MLTAKLQLLVLAVQAGESEKQKSYTAICQLPTAVTPEMLKVIHSTKDLELHQQTPVRVSHRRADLIRLRTVYAMKCEPVEGSPHHIVLQLRTQVCMLDCLTCAMLNPEEKVLPTVIAKCCMAASLFWLWGHSLQGRVAIIDSGSCIDVNMHDYHDVLYGPACNS